MPRKYKRFIVTPEGLPKDLVEILDKPDHISIEGHPLLDYVKPKLIPEKSLDVVLLESFMVFYKDVHNLPDRDSTVCNGMYLSLTNYNTLTKTIQKDFAYLKEKYDLDLDDRVILFPLKKEINYWTLVHELLHDVFNNLPKKTKKKILNSATTSYQSIHDMLDLTNLEISKQTKLGTKIRWPSFLQKTQMRFVDEFLAYFFTNNDHDIYRWHPKHFPPNFKKTLRKIGYKVDSPPILKLPSSLEEYIP